MSKFIFKTNNKYGITPKSIKQLKIQNWNKLKQYTKFDSKNNIYYHIEGCQKENRSYNNYNEFYMLFNEKTNNIEYYFSTWYGLGIYEFFNFFEQDSIENKYDFQIQYNALNYINTLLDNNILKLLF